MPYEVLGCDDLRSGTLRLSDRNMSRPPIIDKFFMNIINSLCHSGVPARYSKFVRASISFGSGKIPRATIRDTRGG